METKERGNYKAGGFTYQPEKNKMVAGRYQSVPELFKEAAVQGSSPESKKELGD